MRSWARTNLCLIVLGYLKQMTIRFCLPTPGSKRNVCQCGYNTETGGKTRSHKCAQITLPFYPLKEFCNVLIARNYSLTLRVVSLLNQCSKVTHPPQAEETGLVYNLYGLVPKILQSSSVDTVSQCPEMLIYLNFYLPRQFFFNTNYLLN